ncbi:MAG: GMC family oxidoreductase [Bdellovibrio sp.]|nr:GMC family oxidoreductase [Bdellovibrio sp.]
MIYTFEHFLKNPKLFDSSSQLDFDVCVVGSGAGGATAAATAAARGARVLLLEAGSFLLPSDLTQREEDMYPKLFYEAGGRRTANRAIRVMHGMGVGGSTLHNINLCKRTPKSIIDSWQLPHLTSEKFHQISEDIEKELNVAIILDKDFNENNWLFKTGTERLGYKGSALAHNRKGCAQSGFCELGCSFNAKMNALRIYIPQVVQHNGVVLSNTQALHFRWAGRRIFELTAQVIHPETRAKICDLNIKAKSFVLSGGGIESVLLSQRSSLPDPYRQLGKHLHLHPGTGICGIFSQDVLMWKGIPQSYECTEFLSFDEKEDKRVWLVGGSAHPSGVAGMLPGFGQEHAALMKLYPKMASISPMLHDHTEGQIDMDGKLLAKISYNLSDSDRKQLARGLFQACKILFAAGAEKVYVPFRKLKEFKSPDQLQESDLYPDNMEIDMVAVHPMSTLRMGVDPTSSVTDDYGRYHHLDNLWVADSSLFPTSLGVPPQISIYSIGRYVGGLLPL